ncbi:putative superfamily III holin-X [Ancylobacter aquaticus]|uniref:Putative superfamily III holin-X n=1 Tax=Ancylobacter aquaticus TaxID=100 RepID=A0A4R1I7D3_ANCAQ|nr:phage holin family protein [Ancylobacter aquaticus]TCK30041.1 putative superfamily III holin-X [Ancylobacter aquaticus]
MLRLLLSIFGSEIRLTARRAGITALLFAIGGLLIGLAALFSMVASFIVLAHRYDALTASLVLAGFTLVVGLIFLIAALLRTRRRRRPAFYGGYGAYGVPPVAPGLVPGAVAGAASGALMPGGVKTVLAIAAGAAVVGLILGRRV